MRLFDFILKFLDEKDGPRIVAAAGGGGGGGGGPGGGAGGAGGSVNLIPLQKSRTKIFALLLVIIVSLFLGYVFVTKDYEIWQGFYYPKGVVFANDPNDTDTFVHGPVFETKEQCLSWGRDKIRNNLVADFECGKDCSYREAIGETVCEETVEY